MEGVKATGTPGLEQRGQGQACRAAPRPAGPAANLALHDNGTQHPLGCIVVGREPRDLYDLEQLTLVAQQAMRQCPTRMPPAARIAHAQAEGLCNCSSYWRHVRLLPSAEGL